jgi:L-iditol 2-dehydrogenase
VIGLAKTGSGPGNLELIERPRADVQDGDARIEVHGAGICGGDLRIEATAFPLPVPVTLGHEFAGVVVETGSESDTDWLGRNVVVEPLAVCRTCPLCLSGRENLCPHCLTIGVQLDGGFAGSVVVPVVNLHRAPAAVGEHAAALCEPLACVCHSLLDPSVVQAGDRVLVVGPGPMGNLAAQVARAEGGDVTLVGLPTDAARLELAASLGFPTEPPNDSAEHDVVIECSGSAGGVELALAQVRAGGTFIQIGLFGKPVTISYDRFAERGLAFRARSAATTIAWHRALELVERGAVDLESLVSAVVPLSAWPEAFADLRGGRHAKIVFDPRLG